MATVDLVMPKLGESIMEATILKWHKKAGDQIKMDETLLEIATDKVDSEVPSTAEGVVEEVLFNVNDVVPIGTVIARINTQASSQQSSSHSSQPTINSPQEAVSQETTYEKRDTRNEPSYQPQTSNSSNRFY